MCASNKRSYPSFGFLVAAVTNTELYHALRGNESESGVQFLLDIKADPNARCRNGLTPMHMAAQSSTRSILELLLSHGGDVHLCNDNQSSLLHSAAIRIKNGDERTSSWEMIQFLIRQGVDPLARNSSGQTPRDIVDQQDWSFAEAYDGYVEEGLADFWNALTEALRSSLCSDLTHLVAMYSGFA